MTPNEIGQKISDIDIRLSKIEVKITNLCTMLDKASGEAGFVRCGVRGEKIQKLEQAVTWLTRAGVVAFVFVGIAELVRFIMSLGPPAP